MTLKSKLSVAFAIFALYFILYLVNIGCPIRFLTGIPCAGCGMSRAMLHAVQLNFSEAFYYHPLFFIVPYMVFLFLFQEKLPKKMVKISWIIIATALILVYIYRLFILKSDVIAIDIENAPMLKWYKMRKRGT